MYFKGYKLLFWGVIFLMFDINIEFINILPDFLGYFMIYCGLKILSSQHKLFIKAKIPALILIVLTLKDVFYDPTSNILAGKNYNIDLISMIIATIVIIIKLYLIYIIYKGIYELCIERGLNDHRDSTSLSWKIYLLVGILQLAYAPFSLNLNYNLKLIFIIIIGIIQIIAYISLAGVFARCKVELGSQSIISEE